MTYLLRLVAHVGKLIGTATGGPGIVVLGGSTASQASEQRSWWLSRASGAAVLAPLAVVLMALLGATWPFLLAACVVLLGPMFIGRLGDTLRRA
jgi:hypothetical protein